jgi:membrane-associated HD superfamily phosphohydrolase
MARKAWLVATLCLAAAPASAQLFVCTTSGGKTITSDRPPPECADRAIRELRSDGSTKRVIEPPLTPEQKAQREVERKKRLQEEEIAREQLRKDKALLEAYSTEAEIDDARDRQIAQRNQMIETAAKRLETHQRERKKLDSELEFYVNRPVPDTLKRKIESNTAIARSEEKIIASLKADIVRINERFDEDRRRFRELVSSGAIATQRMQAAQPAPPGK